MNFRDKFIEDATELLNNMEQATLQLEQNKSDSSLIEEIFRGMHTLKGTAGMYSFPQIGNLTHKLENVFELIRNGHLNVNKAILDLNLSTIDLLNKVLKANENSDFSIEFSEMYQKINSITGSIGDNYFNGNKIELDKIAAQTVGFRTWLIVIKPTSDLQQRGVKMQSIIDNLAKLGNCKVLIKNNATQNAPDIFWEIILASEQNKEEIDDVLLFIDDISQIFQLAEQNLFDYDFFKTKIEEIEHLPQINYNEFLQCIEQNLTALQNTNICEKSLETPDNKHIETIKVPAERLDEQMVLLSELVTTKAEIQLIVQQNRYKGLTKSLEQLEKITRRFRRNIFKIRLIPLESLQLRFDRLIRDLSRQLNKEVDFVAEGMQTELDKTIIDSLESPLMHLIRNSLDHGIETSDIRKIRGKSGRGLIKLTARQVATNVIITVSDDGEGINTAKILDKAISKGIIAKTEKLTESQIFDLIFVQGFSTAQSLSNISGRGVGMDSVKQSISNLRGAIDISSEKGKGTTFTIKLPLSLSIIDTMLVRAGQMFYSIPLSVIEKCTEINATELEQHDNQQVIIEGQLIPYLDLNKKLKIRKQELNTTNEKFKTVIIRNESQKTAILVDEVIGEHQAVLKPLGDYFENQHYISGASQLADGRIAIVLDTTHLFDNL